MKTVQLELFKFDELDEKAQQTAIENCRTDEGYLSWEWYDSTKDDFHEILSLIGFYNIESCFSGFWSQGDGASFSANYSYKKGCLKAVKEYAPLDINLHKIVAALVKEQKRYKYALECEINNRNSLYCHSNTMSFNWNMNGNYWIEWKDDNDEEHLEALIKELADDYYNRLSNEYDYLMTDEAIKEHLICNEYEYLKDGTQYY